MNYFPINLNIHGRTCTVIGGGRVAARKVAALIDYGGRVVVISPKLTEELRQLKEQNKISWCARTYRHGDLHDSFLVIAATDDEKVQQEVQAEAEAAGTLLNVADVPDRCNFILPATVRHGDFAIAISTGGNSPALAKHLRREISTHYGPEYGLLCEILGCLRPFILALGRGHQENKKIFATLLHDQFPDWIREKNYGKIENHLWSIPGWQPDQEVMFKIRGLLDPNLLYNFKARGNPTTSYEY
ncbi:MAG: bifunctional precorrin-2 dehydrogenase/sirohydrochlorin ferrochelatase [Proteobacteria bacterium]|nr:bifunctional precorrin-2 dehydrogenase/sirohydrochlorin ferrochelatase [Pseudomonadota bacterium]MBU1687637.1 bifunctional precorrin-2 dehydrogenase/sirohydrochlorin ferrochelatase [Pseudomonadota bacterium]